MTYTVLILTRKDFQIFSEFLPSQSTFQSIDPVMDAKLQLDVGLIPLMPFTHQIMKKLEYYREFFPFLEHFYKIGS